jgi:ribonuclease G
VSNELIINSTPKDDRIALLRDKRLVEYHIEVNEPHFSVGDIYLGSVKKINTGLNAAFVDIGHEKDGFLHYPDLSPHVRTLNKLVKDTVAKRNKSGSLDGLQYEPETDKFGKITDVLEKNDLVLVQVIKEPISTKGPRLSCDLSIAGRFLVLVPMGQAVNISKKITNKAERQRLQKLMQQVKPANFGIIVRTVAEGKSIEDLERDMNTMVAKWDAGIQLLMEAKVRDKVIGELSRTSAMVRDMLNDDFENIIVDSKEIYEQTRAYIKIIAPEKEKIVKHHTAKTKIFEQFGIEKQLKQSFGKTVTLPGGGYVIIEHTEALHVIDVNSGNKSSFLENQETTAININTEAAKEIARQLRVRDMGGIIVVDFIDMKKPENKKAIFDVMREELKLDRSKSTVLPLSKFGLMQITRQRVRPEMNITTTEVCATCNGTGKASASIIVTDQIEADVEYMISKQNEKGFSLVVHPFIYAYFTKKGMLSKRWSWFWKYRTWINIVQDSSIGLTDYSILNRHGDKIELH